MKLRLMKTSIYKTIGPVTGKTYLFNGFGSIVDVDARDGQIMMNKMSGASCCSGLPPQHIFEVVEIKKSTKE